MKIMLIVPTLSESPGEMYLAVSDLRPTARP